MPRQVNARRIEPVGLDVTIAGAARGRPVVLRRLDPTARRVARAIAADQAARAARAIVELDRIRAVFLDRRDGWQWWVDRIDGVRARSRRRRVTLRPPG